MKIKKNIKWLLLVMLLALFMVGCAGKDAKKEESEPQTGEETGEEADKQEKTDENEHIYEDKVFNLEQTKGKLALYFFRSDYMAEDAAGTMPSGDSTLMITPDGKTVLIDTNCYANSAYVVKALQKMDISRLDYLIFTSGQAEDMGGYATLMRYMEIGEIITNHQENKYMEKAAKEKEIPVNKVTKGAALTFGENVTAEVLSPAADYKKWSNDTEVKNGSLVMKFTCGTSTFLVAGDITESVEAELIAAYGEKLKSDVMRINNHGSDASNSKAWVSAISPKIACAQSYMVQSDIGLGRWSLGGGIALHTILDGSCALYTSGDGAWELQVEKDRQSDLYKALDSDQGHMMVP